MNYSRNNSRANSPANARMGQWRKQNEMELQHSSSSVSLASKVSHTKHVINENNLLEIPELHMETTIEVTSGARNGTKRRPMQNSETQ